MRIVLLSLLFLASEAHATYYSLVSCQFKFVPEYRGNVYIGVYRSQYGGTFTGVFKNYCPATINE